MSRGRALWPVALALAAASACGDDEVIVVALDPPADAGVTDAPPQKPDVTIADAPVSKPKRTVFSRNPFGNVAAKDNLIWDGDFEWFSQFSAQYGWVYAVPPYISAAAGFDHVRTGPECKSGLRCGYLTQNQRLAALGVAPAGNPNVEASVWIKPPTVDCADMSVMLIPCEYAVDADVPLTDSDQKPDAEGWCHYGAISPPRTRSTCLYIEARFVEGEALIDDAVVRAAAEGSVPTTLRATPAESKSLDRARAAIRARLKPGASEARPAREAFERWAARPR